MCPDYPMGTFKKKINKRGEEEEPKTFFFIFSLGIGAKSTHCFHSSSPSRALARSSVLGDTFGFNVARHSYLFLFLFLTSRHATNPISFTCARFPSALFQRRSGLLGNAQFQGHVYCAQFFDYNGSLITPDHMAAKGAGVTQGKRGEVALFCLHFHVFRFHGSKPRRQQQNVGNDLNDPFAFRKLLAYSYSLRGRCL